MKRALWPLLVLSLMALGVLLSLGNWQLNRLAEKQELLAAIDARAGAAPVTLVEALAADGKGEDIEYLKVTVTGSYLANPLQKISTYQGNAAQDWIQGFVTTENDMILVLRGAVPDSAKVTDAAPQNVTVTGIMRRHDGGQGAFDNDNNETENRWYWWDVPAMLAQVKVPDGAKPLTWILHRLPEGEGAPFAAMPKAELRNNHLGYAITWFGLAAVLVVMMGLIMLRHSRESGNPDGQRVKLVDSLGPRLRGDDGEKK